MSLNKTLVFPAISSILTSGIYLNILVPLKAYFMCLHIESLVTRALLGYSVGASWRRANMLDMRSGKE